MATTRYTPGIVVVSGWLNDVDRMTYNTLSAVTGIDAITAVGPNSMSAYNVGQTFYFTPQNNNSTSATTINVTCNGVALGVRNIVKQNGAVLVASDLRAGQVAEIYYNGTNFRLMNPALIPVAFATGTLAVANGGTGTTTIIPVGECRLTLSGGNLLLSPFQGNRLTFPAGHSTVPSAGVTLAPGAVVAGTLYYIYAVQTTGTVTSLEASTTGHSTDTTTGIEIKTGDATRVLVGMARPAAGPVWVSNVSSRLVISWFNRRDLSAYAVFQADRTTASLTYTEINTEIRNEVLSWGDSQLAVSINGTQANNTNAAAVYTSVGLDSTTVAQEVWSAMFNQAAAVLPASPIGISGWLTATEGYHFVTLLGRSVGGGTSTWKGGAVVGERTDLHVKTSG